MYDCWHLEADALPKGFMHERERKHERDPPCPSQWALQPKHPPLEKERISLSVLLTLKAARAHTLDCCLEYLLLLPLVLAIPEHCICT